MSDTTEKKKSAHEKKDAHKQVDLRQRGERPCLSCRNVGRKADCKSCYGTGWCAS